jgi:hypothetical protein
MLRLTMPMIVRGVQRLQRDDGRGVQGVVHPALINRFVDRGLEGVLVDHQVGCREIGDLAGGQLQVVRLGARRSQVADAGVRAGDALGHELEGIERRDDVQLAGLARDRTRTPRGAAGRRQEQGCSGRESADPATSVRHENHFH